MAAPVPRMLTVVHNGWKRTRWQTRNDGVMRLTGPRWQREASVSATLTDARELGWDTYLAADSHSHGLPSWARHAESAREVAALLDSLRLLMGERYAQMADDPDATDQWRPVLLAVHDYGDVMASLRASRDKGRLAIQDLPALAIMGRQVSINVLVSAEADGAIGSEARLGEGPTVRLQPLTGSCLAGQPRREESA